MRRTISFLALASLVSIRCSQEIDPVEDPGTPVHSIAVEGQVRFNANVTPLVAESGALDTRILVDNLGIDTARVRTGPCAFQVLASTSDAADSRLVWHNAPPAKSGCQDKMLIYDVPPGRSVELRGLDYVSGNSWRRMIPRGRWYFVVRTVAKDGNLIWIPSGYTTIH